MTDATLRTVHLLGLPVDIHRRTSEHGETLRRELAFVEHASDPDAAPMRLHELGSALADRYGPLTAEQDRQLAAAVAAGDATVDLHYALPVEVADACDRLEVLLEELDEFCREGDLLTLVTPADGRAYRRWFLREVREQLREGRPPVPWPPDDVLDTAPARAPKAGGDADDAGAATIVVEEDLDLALAPDLREEIVRCTDAGATRVTVDVSGCSFMDSTGLSLLLTSHARLAAAGGALFVVGARGQVASVLEMSGVGGLLTGSSG